jgi:hypothetical protein
MRHLYTLDCKSAEEARAKAQLAAPNVLPKKHLFGLPPESVSPTYKIEASDGELAYTAQLYVREQKMDFAPPPDATALGMETIQKEVFQLVLDFDFFTKKPVARESFDPMAWLTGWHKAINKDADEFLELAGRRV